MCVQVQMCVRACVRASVSVRSLFVLMHYYCTEVERLAAVMQLHIVVHLVVYWQRHKVEWGRCMPEPFSHCHGRLLS